MKIIYSDAHKGHANAPELRGEVFVPMAECPERMAVILAALAKAGLTEADLDWLIPHQANIRIMQSTARKLKMSMGKVVVTVGEHGNTSAASIPLALDHAVRAGQIKEGETVMLEGVGGGFTWGAVLLKL